MGHTVERQVRVNRSDRATESDEVEDTSPAYPPDPNFSASNLRRTWRKLRAKHGLPADYRLYDMRHTHTSVLVAGVASKVIAERLGHAGTRITDDTYSHLMPRMQALATAVIGDLLRAARGE